jgi:hypothetical protein
VGGVKPHKGLKARLRFCGTLERPNGRGTYTVLLYAVFFTPHQIAPCHGRQGAWDNAFMFYFYNNYKNNLIKTVE